MCVSVFVLYNSEIFLKYKCKAGQSIASKNVITVQSVSCILQMHNITKYLIDIAAEEGKNT